MKRIVVRLRPTRIWQRIGGTDGEYKIDHRLQYSSPIAMLHGRGRDMNS